MSFVLQADSIFRDVLDCSVTVPDWSETQSPTGSMCTIRLMASTSTHSGSVTSGLQSITFLPSMESIPDIFDLQLLSGSSTGSLSRQPSLRTHTVNDGAISKQISWKPTGDCAQSQQLSTSHNLHAGPWWKSSNLHCNGPKTCNPD